MRESAPLDDHQRLLESETEHTQARLGRRYPGAEIVGAPGSRRFNRGWNVRLKCRCNLTLEPDARSYLRTSPMGRRMVANLDVTVSVETHKPCRISGCTLYRQSLLDSKNATRVVQQKVWRLVTHRQRASLLTRWSQQTRVVHGLTSAITGRCIGSSGRPGSSQSYRHTDGSSDLSIIT